MHFLKSHFNCILFLALIFFLISCIEDEPKAMQGSTFADTLSGRWEAIAVGLDDELLQEWADFVLIIEAETDTSGWFYAENIPSYDHLETEEREKWLNVWQDSSNWKLDQHEKWYSLVRDDGVELGVHTLQEKLYLYFSLPGWECDPSEEECSTLDFKGSWQFEMERSAENQ